MEFKPLQFTRIWEPPMKPPENPFVQLAVMVNGVRQFAKEGYDPPYGIFVEFRLLEGDGKTLKGMTALLGSMGPWNKCQTVFVVVESGKQRVYFIEEISHWRELIDSKQFTPDMLEYTRVRRPEVS